MEALVHLMFEIIKISLLSYLYIALLIYFFKIISTYTSENSWEKAYHYVCKFKKRIRIGIAVFLFSFMSSHWGSHGLGDFARIPLREGNEISTINSTEYARIKGVKSSNNDQIETTQFRIKGIFLLGNLRSGFYDYSNQYFIYNLKTANLIEFSTTEGFNQYVHQNKLPVITELKSFRENYNAYWHGWRFLLLP